MSNAKRSKRKEDERARKAREALEKRTGKVKESTPLKAKASEPKRKLPPCFR